MWVDVGQVDRKEKREQEHGEQRVEEVDYMR